MFRLVDTTNGLPDNETKALFYVPDGRLGVITTYGLTLYDGCGFRSFTAYNGNVYKTSYVGALPIAYVDGAERVWIKEAGWLTVFDLSTETYINNVGELLHDMGVRGPIQNFFVDVEGEYWIATNNGRLLRIYTSGKGVGKTKYSCRRVGVSSYLSSIKPNRILCMSNQN